MTKAESDALLAFLYAHNAKPQFQCRFRWQKNSIAMWDNRCTQHHATWDYYPETRSGVRVTIKGERPITRAAFVPVLPLSRPVRANSRRPGAGTRVSCRPGRSSRSGVHLATSGPGEGRRRPPDPDSSRGVGRVLSQQLDQIGRAGRRRANRKHRKRDRTCNQRPLGRNVRHSLTRN